MSLSFWVQAEVFYETVLIILSIIVLTLIIMAIFSWTSRNKKVKSSQQPKNKLFLGFILASVVTGAIAMVGHLYYRPYLDEVNLINPLTRDRERETFGYRPYSTNELNYYRNLNNIDSLRQSSLYKESKHTKSVEYLGSENTLHYFTNDRDELYRLSQINIEYVNDINQAQLVGSTFSLVDDDYKNIGFMNPPYIMFERFQIPASQSNLKYELKNKFEVRENNYAFPDWIF